MRDDILIVVLYVVSGKLSLLLALTPGYRIAIYPPSGLAMAYAPIGGARALPAVFTGSLLLNFWVSLSPGHPLSLLGAVAPAAIALASVAQASVGGACLRRIAGYPIRLDQIREIWLFLASAPLVCVVRPTLSVGALVGLGVIPSTQFFDGIDDRPRRFRPRA